MKNFFAVYKLNWWEILKNSVQALQKDVLKDWDSRRSPPPYHAIFVSSYCFFPVELPSDGRWLSESGNDRKPEKFFAISYRSITHHMNY